jgi:hypothetical protein
MCRARIRKKPCRICRRWFLSDPRLKDRQKTCGRSECKRRWHAKKCAQWYRANSDYFKANYLQKKIDAVGGEDEPHMTDKTKLHSPKVATSRLKTGLPMAYVQELIGVKHIIIIEYLAQQLHQRHRRSIALVLRPLTGRLGAQPPLVCSRGDPDLISCNHAGY